MNKELLEDIISHYKHPQHRGVSEGEVLRATNPSCGDDITVYIKVAGGRVESASFDGPLCSIATYGADLLLDAIIGQPVSGVKTITSASLLGKSGADLLKNPIRLKCFEIAQSALGNL